MEWIVESESLSDFVDHGWYTISSKPLVRCKDCKNYDLSKNGVNGQCRRQYATFYAYDYCSYGEHKDE